MTKTFYISDFDGTLMNSSAELSAYTAHTPDGMISNGFHFTATAVQPLSVYENRFLVLCCQG